MEQIQRIVDAGIDFIEISGGTYENPRMMQEPTPLSSTKSPDPSIKQTTAARESFFLQFAATVREKFPNVVLMVTGGFRTRTGMEAALQSGACDLIGVGRPAAVLPALPKEIILNTKDVSDKQATVRLAPLKKPFLVRLLQGPVTAIGGGFQSIYYAGQIQRMAKGLRPVDNRI